jgi:hypothetical protein
MSHIWDGQDKELAVMEHALKYVHALCTSEHQVRRLRFIHSDCNMQLTASSFSRWARQRRSR